MPDPIPDDPAQMTDEQLRAASMTDAQLQAELDAAAQKAEMDRLKSLTPEELSNEPITPAEPPAAHPEPPPAPPAEPPAAPPATPDPEPDPAPEPPITCGGYPPQDGGEDDGEGDDEGEE